MDGGCLRMYDFFDLVIWIKSRQQNLKLLKDGVYKF